MSEEFNEDLVTEEQEQAVENVEQIEENNTKKNKKSKLNSEDSKSINSIFDQFLNTMNKTDKDPIAIQKDKNLFIPSGVQVLDTILGGGIGGYNFTMMVGSPGGGKSCAAAKFIAGGQRKWGDKFVAVYADSEESMTQQRLKDLGCKFDVNIVTGISVEKVFKIIDYVASFKEQNPETIDIPSLVIWDSVANCSTEKILASEEESNTEGAQKAKLIAHYLPKYIQIMNKYNIAMLAINQYRTELNMGSQYSTPPKELKFLQTGKSLPGGASLKYNAFQMIEVKQTKEITTPQKEYILGFPAITVEFKTIKNKAFTPNITVQTVFNYKRGFLNFWTNFNMLKEYKYISAAAWCTLKSFPEIKFRQKEAITIYKENEEFRKAFDNDVLECLQQNIIEDKNSDDLTLMDVE